MSFTFAKITPARSYALLLASPFAVSNTIPPSIPPTGRFPENQPESTFDANARNDLALAVLAPNGSTLIGSASLSGAGHTEVLSNLQLATPGTYFARITGSTASVQLYQLLLTATALVIPLAGDYNHDDIVDAADYAVWRNTNGQSGTGLAADGNGDGFVNSLDYDI